MPPLELSPLPALPTVSVKTDALPISPIEPLAVAEPTTASPSQPANVGSNLGFLGVFGSTFITIFLAELGDKTQFATLLLAAQSHQPGIVFVGAAAALVATSLIGVLVGRWLCQRLAPQVLERATAFLLLLIAGGLIIDVMQM